MKKSLTHISETAGRLFDHPPSAEIRPIGTIPKCPLCGNYGYVNCPQAKAPNGGDFLAIAFQEGTACTCAAGAEFAKNQLEWIS